MRSLFNNTIGESWRISPTHRFFLPIFRLAANYTGIFYNESLLATRSHKYNDIPSMYKILSKDGGPTLILTDMPSCGQGQGDEASALGYVLSILACSCHP